MSHAPTTSQLVMMNKFQYGEVTLPCTAATWQLSSIEHAYWPVDEAYPEATQFVYNSFTYQIMRELPKDECVVTVRILRDSLHNTVRLLFRKYPPFLYVRHLDEWKAISVQCI